MKLENVLYKLLDVITTYPLASFTAGGLLVGLLGVMSTSEMFFFLTTMFIVGLGTNEGYDPPKELQVLKRHPNAVLPTKGEPEAAGYDLRVIGVHETVGDIVYYDTGLAICPPEGYYTEVVPRSSLSKKYGYVLANSVGIIDSGYRGNLLIALLKVEKEKPELDISKPICQLILRKQENCNVVEVDSLPDSVRGTGGFGSTDRKEN